MLWEAEPDVREVELEELQERMAELERSHHAERKRLAERLVDTESEVRRLRREAKDRDFASAVGTVADTAAAMVLNNNVIVGSVNANKRHWYKAGEALSRADRSWLSRLITRREPPDRFMSALHRDANDIKVVVEFSNV